MLAKPWSVVDLSGDDAPLQRAEGPAHSFPPDPPGCLLEVAGEFSDDQVLGLVQQSRGKDLPSGPAQSSKCPHQRSQYESYVTTEVPKKGS